MRNFFCAQCLYKLTKVEIKSTKEVENATEILCVRIFSVGPVFAVGNKMSHHFLVRQSILSEAFSPIVLNVAVISISTGFAERTVAAA